MLGVVIALFAGGFIGLCLGIWLVADNVRHSKTGCLVCGRPWTHIHDPGAHVYPITPETEPYDQDTQGDPQ